MRNSHRCLAAELKTPKDGPFELGAPTDAASSFCEVPRAGNGPAREFGGEEGHFRAHFP